MERTVALHDLQELDNDLGRGPDHDLALAHLLGIVDAVKSIVEDGSADHFGGVWGLTIGRFSNRPREMRYLPKCRSDHVSLPRLVSLESALVDVARGFCPLNAEEEKRITAESIRVDFATFSRAVIAFLGLRERRLPVVSSCSWAAVCYIPRLMGFVTAGGRV